jgi:hypothetical protein
MTGIGQMKISNRILVYFFAVAATAAGSAKSFLTYDKTHKAIWIIPCIIFAVAFFAVAIDLFRWWSKIYRSRQ